MTKTNNKTETQGKVFKATRLIYLLIFLVFGGMILLYSSNTFSSLPVSESNNMGQSSGQNMNQDPHSGADLNALNKIRSLEESLKANRNLSTLLELGHLYNDSGFFQKAIDTYKEYLAEKPKDSDVLIDMGVCYFNMQNYTEAKKVMLTAIEIKPDHQIGKFNLGIVNFSEGNIAEAKNWWKQSIEIDPSSEIAMKAKSLMESH